MTVRFSLEVIAVLLLFSGISCIRRGALPDPTIAGNEGELANLVLFGSTESLDRALGDGLSVEAEVLAMGESRPLLHTAVLFSRPEIVELLILRGADADRRDRFWCRPIEYLDLAKKRIVPLSHGMQENAAYSFGNRISELLARPRPEFLSEKEKLCHIAEVLLLGIGIHANARLLKPEIISNRAGQNGCRLLIARGEFEGEQDMQEFTFRLELNPVDTTNHYRYRLECLYDAGLQYSHEGNVYLVDGYWLAERTDVVVY